MKIRITLLVIMSMIFSTINAQYQGWTIYDKTTSNIPFEKIFNIEFDHSGNVWFGTNVTGSTGHLCKFDGINFSPESMTAWIYGIDCDIDGNIWVINSNDELRKWNGTQWTSINYSGIEWYSDPFFIDHNGDKWMNPGFQYELLRYDGLNWTTYNSSSSALPDARINCINEYNNVLYIGTDSGYVTFNGTNWNLFNTTNSWIPENKVYDIRIDKHDSIWFLCSGGNLVSMKDDNWIVYHSSSINSFSNGFDISNDDIIWICLSNCVIKFDKKEWTTYNSTNSLIPEFGLTLVKIDNNDKVWIGSRNGLITYQNEISDTAINIIEQPKDLIIEKGNKATFKIIAEGNNLSFQWFKDGITLIGATDSIYEINSATYTDSGKYRCEINNHWVSVLSEEARLSVTPPASILEENSLNFTCSNHTHGKLIIQFNKINSEVIDIRLYDLTGKQIFSKQYTDLANSQIVEINVDNLQPSIFLLRINDEKSSVVNKILIK